MKKNIGLLLVTALLAACNTDTINPNPPPTLDATPPTVLSHSPNGDSVSINQGYLELVFSESIKPESLKLRFEPAVAATNPVWKDNNTLVHLDLAALESGYRYLVSLEAEDLAGNKLQANKSQLSFQTKTPDVGINAVTNFYLDSVAPYGSSVAASSRLAFDFSKAIVPSSLQVTISPNVTLGPVTIVTGNQFVYFTPPGGFQAGTKYTVTANANAADGTALSDPFNIKTFSFTTAPPVVVTPPPPPPPAPTGTATVRSVAPWGSSVATSSNIAFSFNQAMDTASVTVGISPAVNLGAARWISNTYVLFDPPSDLAGATTYTVSVAGKDTSGNTLSGTYLKYNFTTAPAVVTPPPPAPTPPPPPAPTTPATIKSVAPWGQTISTSQNIAVAFAQDMNPASVKVTLSPTIDIGTASWLGAQYVQFVRPSNSLLAADTVYTVTISGTSAAGAALSGGLTQYSFKTAAAIVTPPPPSPTPTPPSPTPPPPSPTPTPPPPTPPPPAPAGPDTSWYKPVCYSRSAVPAPGVGGKPSWAQANSWGLQYANFAKDATGASGGSLKDVAASNLDIVVVPRQDGSGCDWTKAQMTAAATNKYMIAYMLVGAATPLEWYWVKGQWKTGNPSFLITADPNNAPTGDQSLNVFPMNHPDWITIMKKSIDIMVAQGFDGAFLDVLDVYWNCPYPDNLNGGTCPPSTINYQRTIDFTCALKNHVKTYYPNFKLIATNATNLAGDFGTAYTNCIDATSGESVWFTSDGSGNTDLARTQGYTDFQVAQLNKNKALGVKVLIIDKAQQATNVQKVYTQSYNLGYVPSTNNKALSLALPLNPLY